MSLNNEHTSILKTVKTQQAHFVLNPVAKLIKATMFAGVAGSMAFQAQAQQEQQEQVKEDDGVEIISVTGSRKTIQNQISIKREATTVVDGLSADDIGDLPALSIGEALESITGAASHRENGGATEITIRGLGPFLSATHINGREATNGSGDRSVNFSQFPSELVKKVAIYKTQDASMIEGGVAGVIALETVQPLDYGKQRIQGEVKVNYNPEESNVENSLQSDLGYRGTFSYVDQFDFDNGQAVGVSFGIQRQDISQPEAEYRSSSPTGSSLWACLNDPSNTNEGFYRESAGDCEDQVSGSSNQGYDTTIDPDTGKAISDGTPYAWTGSSRSFRQNETSDERDAAFFALQYQPSEAWDINFDGQLSSRSQAEARHDLIWLQKRATPGITGPSLITNDVGGILHWEGQARVESAGEQFSRVEDYQGFGLNIEHYATDRLTLKFDLAYSQTEREELQISNRGRTSGDERPFFSWDMGENIPHFTVTDFDVTDISNFDNDLRTRLDRENVRENEVISARFDFDYALNSDVFTSVQGGLRASEMTFLQFGGSNGNGSRNEYTLDTNSQSAMDVFEQCQIDFPETDYLSNVSDGDIVTNVDADGNIISSGTGSSWATYDNLCFSQAIAGDEFGYPDVEYANTGTKDVTETTTSAYIMANYDTQLFGKYIRGNFGLRVVDTDVSSIGFRNAFNVITNDDGTLALLPDTSIPPEQLESGGGYTKFLPSVNLVVDYSEDILLRGGIYRGMSRADPSDMGYSREFQTDTDAPMTINDLLIGANGSGNPDLQPLMSWNYDAAFEWYPNDDAIFAFGFYYKQFQGGFQQQTVLEDFVVEGETVTLPITNSVTSEEESDLFGIETSITYRWDSGIGIKLGYNYADTDFEFEDSNYGNTYETDLDGNTTQLTQGIIPPAGVPGFSEHVFSSQVYYQIGDLDTAIIYKYRSDYFQPYTSNGTRLRYVDSVGVWEMRASYKVNKHFRVKVEAINLFSAPKSQDYYTQGNLGEVNDYGPRLFAGVTFKY